MVQYPMPAPIHDAVTAVLTHGDALLMTRRQPHLHAFPGYWAFPGGKVDRTESDAPLATPPLAAHPPRLMHALVRELREELALDLPAEIAAGRVRRLVALGEVTTPPFAPARFRTWFYRIDFTERPPLTPDAGECAEIAWEPAALLSQRFARGQMLMVPPTRMVMERLLADIDADHVPAFDKHHDADVEVPWIEAIAGLRILAVRSNTLPPADRTNAFLFGDERRVLVDPSPGDARELDKLCALLDEMPFDEVFLTHHHPDHREFADDIARRYRVPIGMSADTRARIGARAPGFLRDLEVKTYADGDLLTQWLGQPVRLHAVPGHDEGQLAVMPDGREWCIVSDLIQGVGTVVVGGPEGNMRKYFASLQRVIDDDPMVVIPSHGMALGTTFRIRETLAHRKKREQQVLDLHAAGKSPDEMLPIVYVGIDPRLLPLARINIESHLTKLREEGRLA
jgi:endoribonuclease LACTB2